MKSTGTFSIMTPRGPWLWVGALNDRVHLGGHRVGLRVTIDPDTGVNVNLGAVPLGSLLLGWMPAHRRCTRQPSVHRCLWKYAPHVRVETAPTHREIPDTTGHSSPAR